MKQIISLMVVLLASVSTTLGQDYLYFQCPEGDKIWLDCHGVEPDIQYSYDKTKWYTIPTDKAHCITIKTAYKSIYFKGVNPNGLSQSEGKYVEFIVEATHLPTDERVFYCGGNIMSLIDGIGETTEIPNSYCFYRLLSWGRLLSAPKLPATKLTPYCYASLFNGKFIPPKLPATTLAEGCYQCMFSGCELTASLELPATTLAPFCYENMFSSGRLTTAPSLPATTLAEGCYREMFALSQITSPPGLPATVLAPYCYENMFLGCDNLQEAPVLPATTLAEGCYKQMFSGCKLSIPPELPAMVLAPYCYYKMFSSCKLTEPPALPATTLAPYCYEGMFSGHVYTDINGSSSFRGSLFAKAPDLPATTLAEGCYKNMFENCINFTTAPVLPATSLADNCYSYMFNGCTSLTSPPELPATILASNCYSYMFNGCTSLTSPPELPATILASNCYNHMFDGCASISTSPKLPATNLADNCYSYMFNGCSNINRLEVSFVQWSSGATDNWLSGVSETGEFVCHGDLLLSSSDFYGNDRIPEGWLTTPIEYVGTSFSVVAADDNITVDKNTATYADEISVTVKNRFNENYRFLKVLINGSTPLTISDYKGSFKMINYLEDVTVSAEYQQFYTITTDEYTKADPTIFDAGDEIYLSFKTRPGYRPSSVNLVRQDGSKRCIELNGKPEAFVVLTETIIMTEPIYKLINYSITTDKYVTADKNTATKDDIVTFTVADRTSEGLEINKVYVNGRPFSGRSFKMSDYLLNISITTYYTRKLFKITTDEYSTTNMTSAYYADRIHITVQDRPGYHVTRLLNGVVCESSFMMPAKDVTITTTYTPINYNITTDGNITIDKSTATINDKVTFSVADRSSEGLTLEKVLLNGEEFTGTSFDMKDYLQDIEIKAVYSKNSYTISTDEYSSVDNYSANYGDVITVSFAQRPGYNLSSATYNGNQLYVSDYQATFTMSTNDVSIATEYTPISYSVTPYDQYVSVDKSSATINDIVNISIIDRTADNYTLNHLFVNGNEINFDGYTAQILMSDYLTDVTIQAEYSYTDPSNTTTYYSVTTDGYCTADKSSVTINDIVNIYIADRTSENYTLTKLLVNGNEISFNGYTAQFSMSDYLTDVTIQAEYTYTGSSNTTYYSVTTDEYCTADKSSAAAGDIVSVSISQRDGYSVNVYCNGIWLTYDYYALFVMPSENVYIYAEYTEINSSQYYNVSTDQYSSTDKTQYAQGETVTVTFSKRDGYNLMSATINNTALNLNGYSATFKMPSNDVSIVAEYKKIEKPVEYTVTNTSEYVSVSTPTAKPGDEVSVFVSRRDGYTPHVFVNGAEVLINGNVAKYIQPSASVVITVDYKKDATTAVTEISGNNPAVSVYPNPARQGEKIVISIDGGIDLRNAKILIYNTHGALVKRIDHAAEYNETNLKSGVYNGVLIYKNGRQTFRIAVY